MVEQAEILEDDADAPPHRGQFRPADRRYVAAEEGEQAAGRPERQEEQANQRGLAGAGGAGEELERLRLDLEGQIAQHFRSHAVAQSDILETDHFAVPSIPVAGGPPTLAGSLLRLC